MRIKASVGRASPKISLFEQCAILDARSDCIDESKLLSHIYQFLAFGGDIAITHKNGKTFELAMSVSGSEEETTTP